jgi:hypothetical protein
MAPSSSRYWNNAWPGNCCTPRTSSAQPAVTYRHFLQLPGFAAEAHPHAPAAQQAPGAGCAVVSPNGLFSGIGLIADPHQGVGQQRDHDRQHLSREAAVLEIAAEPPQRRRCFTKGDHPVELAGVAHCGPIGVVAVLLAPAGIAAGGLRWPLAWAQIHTAVGRWNRQRADALQGGGIAHRVAIGIAVAEALAGAAPADARLGVIDIAQARSARGLSFGGGGVGMRAVSLPPCRDPVDNTRQTREGRFAAMLGLSQPLPES